MTRTTLALTGIIVLTAATTDASAVALNSNQLLLNQEQGPQKGRKAARFDRLDRNNDGVIDRQEFDRAGAGRRGPGARGKRGGPDGPLHAERGPDGPGPDARRGRGFGRAFRGMMGGRHHLRRIIRQEIRRTMRQMHHRRGGMGRGHGGPGFEMRRGHGDGPTERFSRRGGCPNCRYSMKGGERPPMAGPRGDGEGRSGWHDAPDGPRGGKGFGKGGRGQRGKAGRGQRGNRRGGLQQRFEKLDQNDDGVVNRDEFKGPPARFDKLDKNGDGKIEKEELPRGRRGKRGSRGPAREQV